MEIIVIAIKVLLGIFASFILFFVIGWALTSGVLNSLDNHVKNKEKNGKEKEK